MPAWRIPMISAERKLQEPHFLPIGLAWGINDSILSEEIYTLCDKGMERHGKRSIASRRISGLYAGYRQTAVRRTARNLYKVPNFEDYGLGAFLLAGSEVYKMAPDSADTNTVSVSVHSIHARRTAFSSGFSKSVPGLSSNFLLSSSSRYSRFAIFDMDGKKIFEYGEHERT